MSEADALAQIPPEPTPESPESVESLASAAEDTRTAEACVVVKDDATPRGLRTADEAKEVAAAHASMLVDIEACKRVSMARRSFIFRACPSDALCVVLAASFV